MAFELCAPGQWKSGGGLPEGTVSLQKSGVCTVRTEDLAMIGVAAENLKAAVLVDRETTRIAIRQAHDDDGDAVFTLRKPTAKKGQKREHLRQINLNSPLKTLGVKPEVYAGRYELCTKDNLLLLNMLDLSDQDRKLAQRHPDVKVKAKAKAAGAK